MKNLNKYIKYLAILIVINSTSAQQLPTFTQYREYYGIINPASVYIDYMRGLEDQRGVDATFFGLSSRYQWYNSPNPPSTTILHGERIFEMGREKSFHPIVGFQLISDRAGRINTYGAYLRTGMIFSHDPDKVGISVGFNVGFVQYNLRIEPGDDIQGLNVGKINSLHPDIGIGIFGYREINDDDDFVYGGISIPQLYQNTVDFNTDGFSYDKVRHIYIMGGYNKELSARNYAETNVWMKKVGSLGWAVDMNTRYTYDDRFIFGGGYSTFGVISLETAVIFPIDFNRNKIDNTSRIKLGLGFEQPLKYNSIFGNSFEINISYTAGKKMKGRKWDN